MAFLLDTNAWIVFLKSPASKIRDRLESLDPKDVFVCSIVKAELFHGALKYGNPERRMLILSEFCALFLRAVRRPRRNGIWGDSA
jgi:tRNA(fMet)-specific endonuclease VapC